MEGVLADECYEQAKNEETGKQWRCEDVPKDRPPNNTTLLPWMI